MESFVLPSIEMTVESGVGNPNSVDPLLGMSRSKNGKIWTSARYRKMGKVGEYDKEDLYGEGTAERQGLSFLNLL